MIARESAPHRTLPGNTVPRRGLVFPREFFNSGEIPNGKTFPCRIDLAAPLNASGNIKKVQFLVKSKTSF